ncbi:MAG: hypothetical protein WC223_01020 [Bacteroidales bacterium]|jgi:hypothetical protein
MICKLAFYLCISTFCTAGTGALLLHTSDAISEIRQQHKVNVRQKKSKEIIKEGNEYDINTLKHDKPIKLKK